AGVGVEGDVAAAFVEFHCELVPPVRAQPLDQATAVAGGNGGGGARHGVSPGGDSEDGGGSGRRKPRRAAMAGMQRCGMYVRGAAGARRAGPQAWIAVGAPPRPFAPRPTKMAT